MKLKTHILPAFVCATFIAVSPALHAQGNAPDSSTPPSQPAGAPSDDHHKDRVNPLERLAKALDLTDDQKAKIKPIFEDRRDKMKALRDDASLTPEQKKEKAKGIMEDSNAQIKALLTPDQVAKFDKFLAEMKDHREHQGQSPDKQ